MVDRALQARRESKTVDFKRSFDPTNAGDWCELIKDIVAMANSGGGHIVIGVEDNGTAAADGAAAATLTLDPAQITDKVAKYTGTQFDGFAIIEGMRGSTPVAVIAISPGSRPLVFEKPGTYPAADGKQKTAFGVGTVYVRHGAKSEPANAEDVARIFERLVQAVRREWLSGVRRVVNAPRGSTVNVLPPGIRQSSDPNAAPIRLTADPAAPEYRMIDPDATHPWRQKELIAEINTLVKPVDRINQFDIRAVRHLYDIDGELRHFHKAKFGAPQYSPEFRDWLLGQYQRDPDFFRKSREEFKQRRSSS
jgi:hypothetical protein